MERAGLKLVGRDRSGALRPAAAVAVGICLLAAAGLATWLGADAARRPPGSLDLAHRALARALEMGNDDADVRSALLQLRGTLGRRPLDSQTRAIYAGLLLSLCRRLDDTRAPAFHADLAVDLAPVTVPVVERAALVLARSRRPDRAVELVRQMFAYDPRSAADLLLRLEGLLLPAQVEAAVAGIPEALLAWSHQLRIRGRPEEADAWLDRAHARWPDHLPTVRQVAARAVRRADWEALGALFPPGLVLPEEAGSAPLLAYRARLRAERGDAAGAAADASRALELAGERPHVGILAGDALEAAGEHDRARSVWNRVLFSLGDRSDPARRNLLLRLARLEDRHGRPATALRLWRSLLELDPEQTEARRRVDELSGFRR